MTSFEFPTEDRSSDLEASSGFTNQDRIVDGMDDAESISGYYESANDEWEYEDDPIESDIDRTVPESETPTDEQIDRDERYAITPYGEDAADDYWADFNEYHGTTDTGVQPEEFELPVRNPHIIALEQSIKDHVLAAGLSETDAAKVTSATFHIKDSEGNPTDRLTVEVSHYQGTYSRPGVQGFYIAPIGGEKDQYDRDTKYARGSFWGSEQSDATGSFSMTYAGDSEVVRQYAEDAMQPETLANAELVAIQLPTEEI